MILQNRNIKHQQQLWSPTMQDAQYYVCKVLAFEIIIIILLTSTQNMMLSMMIYIHAFSFMQWCPPVTHWYLFGV